MTRNNSDFDSPHLHEVSDLSSRGWQEELGADDFLTGKVWPGQLPQTFETEIRSSTCSHSYLLQTVLVEYLGNAFIEGFPAHPSISD